MGTIRPGVYKKKMIMKNDIKIVRECVQLKNNKKRVKVYDTISTSNSLVNLEGTEIIIAGGKGMGGEKGFQMLKELAQLLGGTIAATRGAVEEGWISRAYQVGQTGRIVRPKLYIACGISGAMQHIVGMSMSDTIIAINNDRNAPIFRVADYGIVGDVHTIIPALISKVSMEKKQVDINSISI